jgi:2-dehydropantoate 2-reductase
VKILVVAAGAVGSVFGARLAQGGHEVELVARPDHVAAIRERGLRVDGVGAGTFRLRAVTDVRDASEPERVVIAAKTFDLATVAAALGTRFPRLPPTLLPQNGLHVEATVERSLRSAGVDRPAVSLVRAVTLLGATLVGPGVVRQVGDGELILQDPERAGASAAWVRSFRDVFAGTSIHVRTVPDLERELWRKALVNAAINPVTALEGVVNGRLGEPPYREQAQTLLREAQRAAALAGYPFSDAEADADLERVIRDTAENRSSMLQDWERGRPTEVDAISGEILKVAGRARVDLPATRAVVARLRAGRGTTPTGAQRS